MRRDPRRKMSQTSPPAFFQHSEEARRRFSRSLLLRAHFIGAVARLKLAPSPHAKTIGPLALPLVWRERGERDKKKACRVSLKVSVKDTNNHAPEFDQPWYTFTVDEGKQEESRQQFLPSGKVHPEIARLRATDQDCGHPYGQICKYEITNGLANFPFSISPEV